MAANDFDRRSTLVNRLTAPIDPITEPEGRRQAQFLAGMLLALVPLGILAAILPSLVGATQDVFPKTSFYIALGGAASGAVAYHLSRTKDYKLAAVLTVSVAWLATLAAAFTDSTPIHLDAAVYLVIPVLLASVLLSMQATLLVVVLNVVALLILPLFVAGASWVGSVLDPLIFNVVVALLILLVANHRNLLESDRRAELEQRIQARTDELVQANDLLKRQMADARLAEERNLLRTLIDNLPDPVFVKDTQGRIIINNVADARAFGLTPAESVGKTDFDLFPQELAEQYQADEQAILQSGEARVDYEEPSVDQQGNPRWSLTTKVPLRDSQGNVVGLVGVNRDITERKQSDDLLRQTHAELERRVNERTAHLREQMAERERIEQELQQQRDFALQVMNALGPGLTVTDQERRFVFVNPSFAQMLGYTPDALIGKTPMDLAFPEELPLLDTAGAERRAGKATTYEMRLRRADGLPIPVLVTGAPRWQDGKVVGAIGSITDLTGRKQAEEALRLSEERFSKAFHANPSAIVIASLEEGRIVDGNDKYLHLIGYSREEALGRTVGELGVLVNPDERRQMVERLREQGSISQMEGPIRTKSGQLRYALASLEIIELSEQPHILGMLEDVTERKQAEEALRETNHTLRALIEGSPIAIITLDEEANVRLWNPAAERLFGWTAEEILGKPYPLVTDEKRSEFNVLFAHVMRGGSLNNLEVRRLKRDGAPLDVSLSSAPLLDAQGRITGTITMMADLTERKRAEEALRASEEASRQFQEQLKALHEITIEMSSADSVDDICRLAVELGRSRLGFDRLGIWFVDEAGDLTIGSFGIDEQGRIRDERGNRIPMSEDRITSEMLTDKHLYYRETAPLYNEQHEAVGQGWVAMAALWDGGQVIGSISADNLIQQQPVSKYQLELLNLYGSTIGHLCTRKRTEAAERDQRQLAEALRDTAAAINSTLELDTMLDRLLVQVERVIPYDASTIMLIEDGYANVARFRNWRMRPETEWIKSHIGAPIQVEGAVIGFLSISSATPGRFTQDQTDRLKAFADQAAIAIQNAHLYAAVRRHADELEHRVAERTLELERERAQLQTILDGMGEGVTGILFDENQRIQRRYINKALFELLGYSAEELDPIMVQASALSKEELLQRASAVDRTVVERGAWRGESRLRRKNGTAFDAYFNINRVDGPDGKMIGMVTIIRDISQEKALQDQRARFVAHASHELRTPITNLKTRLYLMHRQPEKLNEHLAVVEEVTERMKKLVEDLLDLSRLERGAIPLRQEYLELQNVIMNVIRVQQPEADRKTIKLTCDLAPNALYIYADRERIIQVITNLVTNAINYTPEGGSVHIVAESDSNGHAIVYVEDTGVGIAPDHLPHIFQPFYRVGDAAEGTGLGLSITWEIVEMHQGSIAVESELGRGSRFTLTFACQAVNS